MTKTLDIQAKYLDGGIIDASNKHLFSPAIREAYEFFEGYGFDTPINPIKHQEVLQVQMHWKWRPKLQELKKTAPETPFREIVKQLLDDLFQPEFWSDDEVLDLIIWAKKTWQEAEAKAQID